MPFTHGENGDLFVQKAPAATLFTLATALKEIYAKVDPRYGDTEVRVIGTVMARSFTRHLLPARRCLRRLIWEIIIVSLVITVT